jgi:N-acetyltransferase
MPSDLQPTLKGDLVELRPLREDDFDALYAVASDPLIWEQHPNPDRCTLPVFTEFFREAIASGGALIVTDAGDGRVIGSSQFRWHDEEQQEMEIGWTFLARSHWGGAVNGEMKRLMLRHAFGHAARVVFFVGPANWRSRKALEKIGAGFVGIRLNRAGGESAVYQITRPHCP